MPHFNVIGLEIRTSTFDSSKLNYWADMKTIVCCNLLKFTFVNCV